MKISRIVALFLLAGIISFSGCKSENKELKKEAQTIAGVMCKTLGIMNELKKANPADSAKIIKLQLDYRKVQEEMNVLYEGFRAKHEGKDTSARFNEEFRKYLNESMLDCRNLSKEDRESFEKGAK